MCGFDPAWARQHGTGVGIDAGSAGEEGKMPTVLFVWPGMPNVLALLLLYFSHFLGLFACWSLLCTVTKRTEHLCVFSKDRVFITGKQGDWSSRSWGHSDWSMGYDEKAQSISSGVHVAAGRLVFRWHLKIENRHHDRMKHDK